jgi:hypothetical protein
MLFANRGWHSLATPDVALPPMIGPYLISL